MNTGDLITFDAKKNFTFLKVLGGGTGDTLLFKDESNCRNPHRSTEDVDEWDERQEENYCGLMP